MHLVTTTPRALRWSACGCVWALSFFLSSAWASPPTSTPKIKRVTTHTARTDSLPQAHKGTSSPKQNPQRQLFARGLRLCRSNDWENAFRVFTAIKKRFLIELPSAQQARLFLFLGISHANLLHPQRSRSAFEKALLLDPCVRLPRDLDLAPQLKAEFLRVREPFRDACLRQRAARASREQRPNPRTSTQPKSLVMWPDPNPDPSWGLRMASWGLLGSGSLLLVSGLASAGLGMWYASEREEQPRTPAGTERVLELEAMVQQQERFANILYGAGGVLLFTGIVLQLSRWAAPKRWEPVTAPPKTSRLPGQKVDVVFLLHGEL